MNLDSINFSKGRELIIFRDIQGVNQTTGVLFVIDGDKDCIFSCVTLELPWFKNEVRKSCIPQGVYNCVKHFSMKHGNCIWVKEVLNRSEILIHKGNFHYQTKGCILVGKFLKDINHDCFKDTILSTYTLDRLLLSLPQSFKLTIVSKF